MPIKTVVDKLDGIEESLHDLYEQRDGKFVLQIEGIDEHPSVVALKNGHTNSKRERDEARRKLAEAERTIADLPEGFSVAEWDRLTTEDEARKQDPDNKDVRKQIDAATAAVERRFEGRIAALNKTHEEAITAAKAESTELTGALHDTLVIGGLQAALAKARVKPTLMKAALGMFREDVEIVIEDGKRVARMKTDLGGDEVEKYIMNWAQGDEAKDFVTKLAADDEPGSQIRRSEGVNPFAKGSWNMTQQGLLIKSDRAKAERFAKAAGFASLDAANMATAPLA